MKVNFITIKKMHIKTTVRYIPLLIVFRTSGENMNKGNLHTLLLKIKMTQKFLCQEFTLWLCLQTIHQDLSLGREWVSLLYCDVFLPCQRDLCQHETISSVQFNCSVLFDSLRPQGLQHTRLPCPSPTPRAFSVSCTWSL